MLSPEDVEEILPRLAELCEGKPVVLLYLYGSHAKGTQTELSDVDMGVLLDLPKERRPDFEIRFIGDLMEVFGREDMDLVVLNDAGPLLRDKVIREGRLVYGASEAARIAFESRTIAEYLDFRHYSEIYNRYLFDAIRRGEFLDRPGDRVHQAE